MKSLEEKLYSINQMIHLNLINKNHQKVVYCLNQLLKLPVTVRLMRKVGIGKTVNSLRKTKTPKIVILSTQLLRKWKRIALDWFEEHPDSADDIEDDNSNDLGAENSHSINETNGVEVKTIKTSSNSKKPLTKNSSDINRVKAKTSKDKKTDASPLKHKIATPYEANEVQVNKMKQTAESPQIKHTNKSDYLRVENPNCIDQTDDVKVRKNKTSFNSKKTVTENNNEMNKVKSKTYKDKKTDASPLKHKIASPHKAQEVKLEKINEIVHPPQKQSVSNNTLDENCEYNETEAVEQYLKVTTNTDKARSNLHCSNDTSQKLHDTENLALILTDCQSPYFECQKSSTLETDTVQTEGNNDKQGLSERTDHCKRNCSNMLHKSKVDKVCVNDAPIDETIQLPSFKRSPQTSQSDVDSPSEQSEILPKPIEKHISADYEAVVTSILDEECMIPTKITKKLISRWQIDEKSDENDNIIETDKHANSNNSINIHNVEIIQRFEDPRSIRKKRAVKQLIVIPEKQYKSSELKETKSKPIHSALSKETKNKDASSLEHQNKNELLVKGSIAKNCIESVPIVVNEQVNNYLKDTNLSTIRSSNVFKTRIPKIGSSPEKQPSVNNTNTIPENNRDITNRLIHLQLQKQQASLSVGNSSKKIQVIGPSLAPYQCMYQSNAKQLRKPDMEALLNFNHPSIPPEKKLFVYGLSCETNVDLLKVYFRQFGVIIACNFVRRHCGSISFAFIAFDDATSVNNVLSNSHHFFYDRYINTDRWSPKPRSTYSPNYIHNRLVPMYNFSMYPT